MRREGDPDVLTYEAVLAQLRHAYENLVAPESGDWTPRQRKQFANGLIAPQIVKLEKLHLAFDQQEEDVIATFASNARWRRRWRTAQHELLAQANAIGSASQARRIIMSVFSSVEREP